MLQMIFARLSIIHDVASAANAFGKSNKAESLNMNELHGFTGVGLCK